jgi:hypothetical protein
MRRARLGWRPGRIHCSVRPSAPLRLVALLLALIAALATPGLAIAHGLAHDHLTHEHAAKAGHGHELGADAIGDHHDDRADHDAGTVLAPTTHGQEHGHAVIDVAPGARELPRIDLAAVAMEPPAAPDAVELSLGHAPAIADHALLARPDPDGGPPPRLRAPPVG